MMSTVREKFKVPYGPPDPTDYSFRVFLGTGVIILTLLYNYL